MAEERVILQVKFDQIRSAGVGAATRPTDGGPRVSNATNRVNGSRRGDADQFFDALRNGRNGTSSAVGAITTSTVTAGVGAATAAATSLSGPLAAIIALLAHQSTRQALKDFRDAITRVTEELRDMQRNAADLNASVAAAVAISERNVLIAQRRQAGQLEDELVRLVRANNAIQTAIIDLKTSFANIFLPKILPFIEAGGEAIGLLSDILRLVDVSEILNPTKRLEELINKALAPLGAKFRIQNFMSRTQELLQQIRDKLPQPPRERDFEEELDRFFDPDVFLTMVTKKDA